jgi:hypothetical protein
MRMCFALRRILPAAAALVLAGCSEFGHVRPDALQIRDADGVVVHARGTRVEGRLTAPAGGLSAPLTVHFLDGDGRELHLRGYQPEVASADPAIAAWLEDAPGSFGGRIAGGVPGSTVLLVRWMHGMDGLHKDREWAVEVTVTP